LHPHLNPFDFAQDRLLPSKGERFGLARGVIDEQFLLALLADIVSFEEDIDRAVKAVSVRDIRAINPALVAELFDGERQQFLIDLEAEVNLSALDVFLGKCLPL